MTAERAPAGWRASPLTVRLAVAFLSVAVLGVAILATLTILSTGQEIGSLLDRQHRSTVAATARAAADAYAATGSWADADLTAARAVADSAEAELVVADSAGVPVPAAPRPNPDRVTTASSLGDPVSAAVLVEGHPVGEVQLRFPTSHDAPAYDARSALWRTVIAGTMLAAAVALVVAVFVATRLTRPLTALSAAATRMARGERGTRTGVDAPGELGELARAIDDLTEQLDDEDRARRRQVTDVAHELRTPLAVLQAETEALVDGVRVPDRAALESLHGEVARLTRLVTDLEALAAADAGRLALHRQPLDLADVAARAVAAMAGTADDRRVQLVTDLRPVIVDGDPDRLLQVVLNLASNAVKFTPPGGSVTIRTSADDTVARLVVLDDGPGFAPGEKDHAFERFWQGQAGSAAGTGTGVGLAVASRLVAAHGGTILVANRTDGQGAVVTVALPPAASP